MSGKRRNLLDQILVSSISCLCIVDARRRIRFFSPGMEAWTGWSARTIEGLSCDGLAAKKNNPSDLLAAAFNPATACWQGDVTFWRAVLPAQNGELLQSDFCSVPLCNDAGQVERVVALRIDQLPSATTELPPGQQLHAEIAALRADFRHRRGWDYFLGEHPSMTQVRQLAGLLEASRCHFTIHGEAGTGRRHLAECIHAAGHDAELTCVPVDCDLLSPENLYDALQQLQHMAAEHSGTHEHPGLLLLLNVHRMPREVQQWLLDHATDHGPVRLASTSDAVLESVEQEGWMLPRFRELIGPVQISLPRLHDRGHDVLLLAQEFIHRNRRLRDTSAQEVSQETAEQLLSYRWPGNIRELEQLIHDACDVCNGAVIEPDHLSFAFRSGVEAQKLSSAGMAAVQSLDALLKDTERRILQATLECCGQNKAETARRLGLTRPALYRRLKSHGLDS